MKKYFMIAGVCIMVGFIVAPVDTAHVLSGAAKGFIEFVRGLNLR